MFNPRDLQEDQAAQRKIEKVLGFEGDPNAGIKIRNFISGCPKGKELNLAVAGMKIIEQHMLDYSGTKIICTYCRFRAVRNLRR